MKFLIGFIFILFNSPVVKAQADDLPAYIPLYIEKIYQSEVQVFHPYSFSAQETGGSGETEDLTINNSTMKEYVVLKGDHLFNISRKIYGTDKYWKELYKTNGNKITDPNIIKPGMIIKYRPELQNPEQIQKLSQAQLKSQSKLQNMFEFKTIEAEPMLSYLEKWVNEETILQIKTKIKIENNIRIIDFSDLREQKLIVQFGKDGLDIAIQIPPEIRKSSFDNLSDSPYGQDGIPLSEPKPITAFVNFYGEKMVQYHPLPEDATLPNGNISMDGAINTKSWVLEGVWNYTDQKDHPWFRQESRIVKDWPDSMVRLNIGDLQIPTTYYQSYITTGGISLTRNFDLQPYRVFVPGGHQNIFLKTDSTVTIIRNGQKIETLFLSAGQHNLKDLPLLSGLNEVTLEIVDSSGRKEIVTFNLSSSGTLLKSGIHQFTYDIGYESSVINNEVKYDHKRPMGSFYHRYGFSDTFTAGVSSQGDVDQNILGGEGVLATSVGVFTLASAKSLIYGNLKGTSQHFNYSYSAGNVDGRYHSFSFTEDQPSENFVTLGTLVPTNPYTRIYELIFSQSFTNNVSYNFTLDYSQRRDITVGVQNPYLGKIGVTKNWDNGISFNLNLSYSEDIYKSHIYNIQSLMTWVFPEQHQSIYLETNSIFDQRKAQWNYNNGKSVNRIEASVAIEKNLGLDNSEAQLSYLGNRGLVAITETNSGRDYAPGQVQTADFTASTGIAWAGNKLTWGQPITDSFIIVQRPSQWKDQALIINPIMSSDYEAKADGLGAGLLSNNRSYQYHYVTFDETMLNPGYTFQERNFKTLPTYKSGFLLSPGSESTILLIGKINDKKGDPVALVSGEVMPSENALVTKKIPFFTDDLGNFVVEGLKPGNFTLQIYNENLNPYLLNIQIPEESNGTYNVGTLIPNNIQ